METTLTVLPNGAPPLAALAPSVDAYVGAARAASTRRIYRSDWAQFVAWCTAQEVPSLPAHPATVAAYLAQLADAGLKASTINRKVSAIRFAHTVAEVDNPTAHPLVMTTAAGIRRRIGVAPQGKAPACTEQLRMMLATMGADVRGLRDAALLKQPLSPRTLLRNNRRADCACHERAISGSAFQDVCLFRLTVSCYWGTTKNTGVIASPSSCW